MKKFSKLVAVAAIAVMVVGSTLTVSAASVNTANAAAAEVSAVAATTADGTAVAVNAVSPAIVAAAEQAIATVFGGEAANYHVEKCFDLSATLSGPTDITIQVPGITAGQKVKILHYNVALGAWENIPVAKVSAGAVTGTFTSLSPVAIVTTVSPKTGESAPIVGCVLVLSTFGAAICARKFALN